MFGSLHKYSSNGDKWMTGTYDEAKATFTPYPAYATPTLYDSNPAFYASKVMSLLFREHARAHACGCMRARMWV